MTVVTSCRAVDVLPAYAWVRHARLVRSPSVAVDAGERRIVRRDQVAVRTDRAIMRNAEPVVLS
jgi:hypothetical protein